MYTLTIQFNLNEGGQESDHTLMLDSLKATLTQFFDMHPFYFKDVHTELTKKKEEENA
jgi:hypothetical protein